MQLKSSKKKRFLHIKQRIFSAGTGPFFLLGLALFWPGFSRLQAQPGSPPDEKLSPDSSLAVRRDGRTGAILKKGEICIALQRDYPPFHVEKPVPGYPGMDVELGDALARALGVRVVYRYADVADLLKMIADGKCDVALGGISATPERGRYVDFTHACWISSPAVLLKKRALGPVSQSIDFSPPRLDHVEQLQSLGSLTLDVKEHTTHEAFVKQSSYLKGMHLRTYPDRATLLKKLESEGDLDGIVVDDLFLKALLLEHSEYRLHYLPVLNSAYKERISMVVPPGEPGWVLYLNLFIEDMRSSGELRKIEKRYLESSDWIPSKIQPQSSVDTSQNNVFLLHRRQS